MNGYMGLFLETGDPAFYMMAKQGNADTTAASSGAAGRMAHSGGNRWNDPETEEETSPR